jgi:hypothetical protein
MRLAALAGLTLAAAACGEAGEVGATPGAATEPVVGSFAAMALTVEEGTGGEGLEVVAQFVAYAGPGDRWAMQALDVWSPPPLEWGVDRCELVGAPHDTPGWDAARPPSIHLLDAGPLTIATEQPIALQVRRVPDLMGTFSGAVYRLPQPHALPYTPGQLYTVRGGGGHAIGDFEVTLQAPRPLSLSTSTSTDGLLLAWGGVQEGEGKVVYADIYHDALSSQPQLRCVLVDDGAFTIPDGLLSELRALNPGATFRDGAPRRRRGLPPARRRLGTGRLCQQRQRPP